MSYINSDYTQFTSNLVEDLTSRLHSAYCREDALTDYEKMEALNGTAGRAAAYDQRKWDLVKKLKTCGCGCDQHTSAKELKKMIDSLPNREALEVELYRELYRVYSQFPSASDFMARLVRRLADPDLVSDSIRLTIVKQFIRYTKFSTLAVKDLVISFCNQDHPDVDTSKFNDEDVIRYADERIFDVLNKSLSRDERRRYALIRLADDLAGGKFRMGGKTKTDLYTFAFAFKMTAFTGRPGEKRDQERDLEKNLFRDFYSDNLLRYATEDFLGNAAAYEQEPSGEGINYKNFAEVIYLYYLNKTDSNPRKRLTAANKCIDRCVARILQSGPAQRPDDLDEPRYTRYYHDQFLQKVCDLSEKELEDFICANYEFPDDLGQIAKISAEAQRRTAAQVYDEILAQVLDNTTAEELSQVDYGVDANSIMDEYASDEKFTVLMEQLNKMLTIRLVDYPVSGTPAGEKVTRTGLIALYAYHYLSMGWAKGLSMPRLLKNFRTMIDPLLERSRFQPISEKNVFDIFTVMVIYHVENHITPLA